MVMWKVNAGRRSRFAQDFIREQVVAVGWHDVGDPTAFRSKEALTSAVAAAYPDKTTRQSEVSAGQLWRFIHDLKDGEEVTTYDPDGRTYWLGELKGGAIYQPTLISELPTVRKVVWTDKVSRDDLSAAARGKLGAILTLYQLAPSAAEELRSLAAGGPASSAVMQSDDLDEEIVSGEDDPYEAIAELALERVKDRLSRLAWDDMQELVAALLRALGYRTIVSPAGADRGKDIVASRDGFGFERPRIVVEVKHRRDPMGAPEVRSFIGGRHADDRGLYVSTGGFTREAYYEAERALTVTHLMTLDGLARALVENYEALDERGRALLPLTKIYWPA